MLLQGAVRPALLTGRSQAHPGVHPLSPLTHRTQRAQRLPPPLGDPPYHYDLETALPGIGNAAARLGHLTFHTVGDTGGVKDPHFQIAVAEQMQEDLNLPEAERPAFFYHLGDVVYFNGEYGKYYEQFYEPYARYTAPIISIPGNHDGDPGQTGRPSLEGWMAYFMTPTPHVDEASGDSPRVTLSQPNVFFTLVAPFVTVVGLYTNVPEHGSVDSDQQQWLTNELQTAPRDKALVVSLHHPIYSFDNFHSGSSRMADVLQQAVNDSRRVPNLVLTAHVHNYQRIEQSILSDAPTPFLVAGNGGYYNLHHLTAGPGAVDPDTGAKLIVGDDKRHGYVTLTVSATRIRGTVTAVDKAGNVTRGVDTFDYPAAARFLPENAVLAL